MSSDSENVLKKISKCQDAQLQRMLDIAKERGKSMKELLQFDVCSSSSLFDEEGLVISAAKSPRIRKGKKS